MFIGGAMLLEDACRVRAGHGHYRGHRRRVARQPGTAQAADRKGTPRLPKPVLENPVSGHERSALLTPPLRLADPLFQCVASDQRGSLAARRVSVKRFRHDIGSHLTERYLDIGHCSTVEGDSIIRITARREHFTEAQIVDLTLRTTVCGFFDKLNDALQIAKEPEAVSPPPPPARPSLVLP
jgi:hypothetical protein